MGDRLICGGLPRRPLGDNGRSSQNRGGCHLAEMVRQLGHLAAVEGPEAAFGEITPRFLLRDLWPTSGSKHLIQAADS